MSTTDPMTMVGEGHAPCLQMLVTIKSADGVQGADHTSYGGPIDRH
ncbi:hypothetical protein [Paracoccus aestuarii]|nr:hypothetical protein [Paracoccus aestuarii]